MRITTEKITGLAHCAALTAPGQRCPGYEQAEVPAVRELVEFLYSDLNGGSGDPIDQAFAHLVERSVSHLHFADEADRPCPHCGEPRELADQVRPQYQRLSDVEPDELLRRQRVSEHAATAAASAAERQATALEALAAQGVQAGEVEQLREVIDRQQAQIDRLLASLEGEPNGHARPRRAAAKG